MNPRDFQKETPSGFRLMLLHFGIDAQVPLARYWVQTCAEMNRKIMQHRNRL